jgi:hypothetical protein
MTAQLTTREERGQQIVQLNGQIQNVDELTYTVKSQSGNGEYCITKVCGEWLCECPDNKYRHVKCKHIFGVELSLKIKEQVKISRVIEEVTVSNCVYCYSSNTKKFIVRRNK